MRRFVAALAIALGLIAGTAGVAFAHASLVSTKPANGATLAHLPHELTLTFNEPISRADIAAHHPDGEPLSVSGAAAIDATVSAHLGTSDEAGKYHVAWRVISADGHVVDGDFTFTVTEGRAVTPHAPHSGHDHPGGGTNHWGILAAIALAVIGAGVFAFRSDRKK